MRTLTLRLRGVITVMSSYECLRPPKASITPLSIVLSLPFSKWLLASVWLIKFFKFSCDD
jgi:hypothetical protein